MSRNKTRTNKDPDEEFRRLMNADAQVSERKFSEMLGRDHEVVRRLMRQGVLTRGAGCRTWNREYIRHLVETIAFGKM